jgi:hypothetical protein
MIMVVPQDGQPARCQEVTIVQYTGMFLRLNVPGYKIFAMFFLLTKSKLTLIADAAAACISQNVGHVVLLMGDLWRTLLSSFHGLHCAV